MHTSPMKVSIVTISYNQSGYLAQAIESVLNQDYEDLEYIVVDAGSTDGSREIIEQYRSKINKIIFEPDEGPADGLNKGFALSSGDILGYLNSDDMLLPGAVSKIVQAFRKHPNADVISGHGIVINENNYLTKRIYSHRFNLNAYAHAVCILVQQSTFFKRKMFWKVCGHNKSNRVSWDGELWVDFALVGARFRRIHQFISLFRIYPETISGSGKYSDEIAKQHERICRKIWGKEAAGNKEIAWLINRLSDPIATTLRLYDVIRSKREYKRKVQIVKERRLTVNKDKKFKSCSN